MRLWKVSRMTPCHLNGSRSLGYMCKLPKMQRILFKHFMIFFLINRRLQICNLIVLNLLHHYLLRGTFLHFLVRAVCLAKLWLSHWVWSFSVWARWFPIILELWWLLFSRHLSLLLSCLGLIITLSCLTSSSLQWLILRWLLLLACGAITLDNRC